MWFKWMKTRIRTLSILHSIQALKTEQRVLPESNQIKQWDNHCSGASELFKKGEALGKYREQRGNAPLDY